MNPLLLEFLCAIARWLLTIAGAALVEHHILTADQNDRFMAAILEHLVLWIPAGVGLGWSLWAKFNARRKLLTALDAPAGSTERSVNATIAKGFGTTPKLIGILLIVGSIGLAGLGTACAPKTIQSPQARAAYSADQIVKQLGAFQNAVIDADRANKIGHQDAIDLVTWLSGDPRATPPIVGLFDTLAAGPSDWAAAARQTWVRLRRRLVGGALDGWLTTIDALLAN